MATTANQQLPYPALGDAANGPVAIQNLALAVEKKLVMSFANAAARDAAIPAPTDGQFCYVTADANWYAYINGRWNTVLGLTAGASAPAATALADQYPYGHTHKSIATSDATWPHTTGIVQTFRSTTTRTYQWFYATNGGVWYRFGSDAGPWGAFKRLNPTKILARVEQGQDQVLAHNTLSTLVMTGGTIAYDTDGMVDLPSGGFIIKTAGWYRFTARVGFAANATGYRSVLICRGGTEFLADDYRMATPTQITATVITTDPWLCAVGDVITIRCAQTSGASMTLTSQNNHRASLSAESIPV